jgi:transcriptional regulator with XRE-family HTH domain
MQRQRSGLAQHEIAFLLGVKSSAKLSRYEAFRRVPDIQTVFELEIIYGVSARDLFPGIFDAARHAVELRVARLSLRIAKEGGQRLAAKRAFLNTVRSKRKFTNPKT